MRRVSKRDFLVSLYISLSYFIFWSLAIFISGNGSLAFWTKAVIPFSWQILFVTLANFFLHLVVVPYVQTKKSKWPWTVAVLLLMLLVLTTGFKYWNRLGEVLSLLSQPEIKELNLDAEVKSVLFQLFGMGYFASIKFFVDFYRLKLKNQQLDIEKKISELNYLKSQTHPHFLFNTLNNIYSLTRDKSDLAPVSVLRLSDILRYMLYETDGEKIPVDKEIKIIEDYIELEKIRYDESLAITFTVEADNRKQEIPPLLMIPLVENAFKHGVSETTDFPFIRLQLIINNPTLHFTVENSIGKSKISPIGRDSIGLKNLQRQLELQFTDYQFNIEERKKSFFVSMRINLDSYVNH